VAGVGARYCGVIVTPMRICSLLPSGSEIVASLGLAELLVGVSAECDWPPEVRDVPVVSGSRVDTSQLDDAAIDAAVREQLVAGESLYAIDEALLVELAPDLIITQDLCRACAVSSTEVRNLDVAGAEVLELDPRTIAEIAETVRVIATTLGVPERGEKVVATMNETIGRTAEAVAGLDPPRVFVAEWADPPFASGHWLPEMTAHAGGSEVLGRAAEPAVATTWDEVAACDPELVVVAACGHDAERAAAGTRPPLSCRTVAVDANSYYSRPSPRIADGVAQLAHLLHPDSAPDPGLPAIEL
jgi:iron complex transport system substrate-binding protein